MRTLQTAVMVERKKKPSKNMLSPCVCVCGEDTLVWHARGQRPVLSAFSNALPSRPQPWWNHRKLDCLPFALGAAWMRPSLSLSLSPNTCCRSHPAPRLTPSRCTPIRIPLRRHAAPDLLLFHVMVSPPPVQCRNAGAGCQQSAQ